MPPFSVGNDFGALYRYTLMQVFYFCGDMFSTRLSIYTYVYIDKDLPHAVFIELAVKLQLAVLLFE